MTPTSVVMNPLCTLRDNSGDSNLAVPITVSADSDWLAIRPHGYGEAEAEDGHGDPILLEVWQGELRFLVATDINDANKSVISLEGSRESLRGMDHPPEMRSPHATPKQRELLWRTVAVTVVGIGNAGALALQLLTHSLWFCCTPLPDDEYEFAVKAEPTAAMVLALSRTSR